MSALAPHGSTSLHEMATHSGGCKDMEGNRCLPHVLPTPRRSREHRKGFLYGRRRLLEDRRLLKGFAMPLVFGTACVWC